MMSVTELLDHIDQQISAEKTLVLILETLYPQQEMTLKQIKANYMSLTNSHISDESLKAYLDNLVSGGYNSMLFAKSDRNHYKFLF